MNVRNLTRMPAMAALAAAALCFAATSAQAQSFTDAAQAQADEGKAAPAPAKKAKSAATIPVQPVRPDQGQNLDVKEASQLDTVEVTGSRIRRVDVEKFQPVVSIGRDDIERSGLTSLGDALSKLSLAGSALNTNVNNGGSGSVFVDLRSLGPQRTLVLVNGRRWVNDAGGLGSSVDFSTIPLSIVDHIEVLKDGASAIYGSDAIAGVINVITRKDFSGAQVSSQIGQFSQGDGRTQSHSLTVGSIGGKTSVLMDLSYTQAEPVMAGDRDISKVPVFGVPGNDSRVGSSTNPFGRYFLTDADADGNPDQDLTTLHPGDTQDAADPNGFRAFRSRTDGYNYAPANYLVTPSERTGFFGSLRHELNYDIAFNAEALYQNRKSSQLLAPTPLVLGAIFGDSTVIDPSNTYYKNSGLNGNTPYGDDDFEGVSRRLVEASGRLFKQDVQTYHLGAGFSGALELLDRNFIWDVNTIYNQSVNDSITSGQVNLARVQQALGPVANCTGTEQPDPCVQLNVFGPPGSITPDMLNYILVTEQSRLEQKVHGYTANITGDVIQLPAGALGFAVGFEHRREFGADTPDALVNSGVTSGNARKPTQGNYSLKEFYGELSVPVLADMPFVRNLTLSLATRNSQYDIAGSSKTVTKSKAGLEYRPIDDMLLRVSYAQGFRAPSITELFGGRGDSFPQLADPCAAQNPVVAGDGVGYDDLTPAQQANCQADGVPAGGYPQANSQIKTTVGGEPKLQPEESTSLIYGMVYSPEQVPGLTVNLDVYRYHLDNAISAIDPQTVLDGCANSGNPFFCDRTTRSSAGVITQLVATNVNIGGALVKGFDTHVKYDVPPLFDGRFGNFSVNTDLTYLEDYTQYVLDDSTGGARPQHLAGRNTGNLTTVGGTALPRVKSNAGVLWSMGNFGGSYTLRYIRQQQENCDGSIRRAANYYNQYCSAGVDQDGKTLRQHTVETRFYHDVQATYTLEQFKTIVAVGINNLLNEDPPVSYSAFANSYDPRTYDVPGMFPYARVTVNFD